MEPKIITFGCRLNIYESEVIRTLVPAHVAENAIIFNSCAVTQEAEKQLRQSIRKAAREFPKKHIIVTGCAAQIHPEIYASMEEVDLVLGNQEKLKPESYGSILPNDENLTKIHVTDIMELKENASHLVQGFEGKARAFVEIQNGCDHRCTFCRIPFARGNNRSVPMGEIVTQIRQLVENGFKEIVLTGVDMTDYGKNLPGTPRLGEMIKRLLSNIPKLERLRLSSLDVAEIDPVLFDLLAQEERIMPHIHLSVQAGDNMILKRMKRRHNREQVIEFCHNLKARRPEIVFGADIIAGFPTETEEMFENTLNLVEEAGLVLLHVFPYSSLENTPASRMPQIPKILRKERAGKLRALGQALLKSHYVNQLGKTIEILVEKENLGRARDYTSVTFNEMPNNIYINDLIHVEITGYNNDSLIGNNVYK